MQGHDTLVLSEAERIVPFFALSGAAASLLLFRELDVAPSLQLILSLEGHGILSLWAPGTAIGPTTNFFSNPAYQDFTED